MQFDQHADQRVGCGFVAIAVILEIDAVGLERASQLDQVFAPHATTSSVVSLSSAPGSGMTIEDLGSQNGTHVNGRRINRKWTLQDWSRIQIASTTYLLSFDGSGEHVPGGNTLIEDQADMTVAMDAGGRTRLPTWAGGSHSTFAGDIGAFTLIDVLRVMLGGSPSGVLHVAVEGGEGRIDVRNGEIRHASYQDLNGVPAMAALIEYKHGLFWFVQGSRHGRKTIRIPTDVLLLDLACRKAQS